MDVVKPDWAMIKEQMWLYAAKDGMTKAEAKREMKEALLKMKEEFAATGKMPKGWEGFTK